MPHTIIEGLKIAYDHYQPAAAPPAQRVIYIHGTGCNAKVFEDHLKVVAQTHEVVAIDLPGHGGSQGNGFRGTADHAFFVAALIEMLGWESCIVAGHSLGGGIALSVAIYFEHCVGGLMLIDTGARLRVNPNVIALAREVALGRAKIKGDARLGYAETTAQSVVDGVNAVTAGCDPVVTYKDWVADDSFDLMSRVGQISAPTLAICGLEDPLTPLKYHEYLRDHLADCELVTIERAGHWPFVENPEQFNAAVLQFLAKL